MLGGRGADLDPRCDALLAQHLHEGLAVARLLEQSFLEHDAAADILAQPGGRVQELAPVPAVFLRVLHSHGAQALAGGGVGLIGGLRGLRD